MADTDLIFQSRIESLTDAQILAWVENGMHADAAFAEQQRRNLRELKAIHSLMRQACQLLMKIAKVQDEVHDHVHES